MFIGKVFAPPFFHNSAPLIAILERPYGSVGKEPACNAGAVGDWGSVSG